MGASKSKTAAPLQAGFSIVRLLLRPQHRATVLTVALVAVAIGGAVYGWQHWEEAATKSHEYQLDAAQISVTPQPAWIQADVKQETLRTLASTQLELLDRELVDKIAHAFALHPWVAKVVRVEKRFPARVNVELEYRRPVLVVKIGARGEDGLLFLDREGVLLPSGDFSPSQAKDYLRIVASGETPTSVYGSPWASDRIAGAARVASILENRWQSLGLYWIVAVRGVSNVITYELRDQDDKLRVIWGSAPGQEAAGEPAAAAKIAELERHLHDLSSPEKKETSTVIDLRSGKATNRDEKNVR